LKGGAQAFLGFFEERVRVSDGQKVRLERGWRRKKAVFYSQTKEPCVPFGIRIEHFGKVLWWALCEEWGEGGAHPIQRHGDALFLGGCFVCSGDRLRFGL